MLLRSKIASLPFAMGISTIKIEIKMGEEEDERRHTGACKISKSLFPISPI